MVACKTDLFSANFLFFSECLPVLKIPVTLNWLKVKLQFKLQTIILSSAYNSSTHLHTTREQCTVPFQPLKVSFLHLLPPTYVVRREGNSFTLFVCPHLEEGGSGPARGGQVQPGGVRSSQVGVRSSWGGQVQPGGVRSSWRGGARSSWWGGGGQVQLAHPLTGGMPLAFTQEDFLVHNCY